MQLLLIDCRWLQEYLDSSTQAIGNTSDNFASGILAYIRIKF